jgi:hypothetical protein
MIPSTVFLPSLITDVTCQTPWLCHFRPRNRSFDCYNDTYMYATNSLTPLNRQISTRHAPRDGRVKMIVTAGSCRPECRYKDRATQGHHLCCRQQAPDVRKQYDLRKCCAPTLSTLACFQKRGTAPSIPRNWSMHLLQQPGRYPIGGLLILQFLGRNSTHCVHALFCWGVLCIAHKHLPVVLTWSIRAVCRTQLLIPRTRVDRLERMPFLSQSIAGQTCV